MNMSPLVCLDSEPENMTPALALRCHALAGTWNGWIAPLATAEAFATFIDAWRRNDPNGDWGWVFEHTNRHTGATRLVLEDAEGAVTDTFDAYGTDAEGRTLYNLSGWRWVACPANN